MTIGNPHFVIARKVDAGEAEQYGYEISTHPAFKHGANVEWLNVQSSVEADLVVYERGAGLTLACGTGGGGAAATGVRQGVLAADTQLTIKLPGGALHYTVASDFSSVLMTGPTERVYRAALPFTL
jgi:diaminopimelate epimerase